MITAFMSAATPYVLALSVGLGAFGSWWAYNEGKAVGAEEVRSAQVAESMLRTEMRDAVQAAVAEGFQRIEVKNETVVRNFKTIEKQIPVYRECVHPEPAIRLLNSALRGGDEVRTEPSVPGGMP